MDSGTLADAFDYVRQRQLPIHSLVVVRNGYVVLDAYFYPFQKGQVHDTASVTKSVTSTLVGIAFGRGKLSGVRQPVLAFFPKRTVAHRDLRKGRISIENLLSMTSGLDCRFRPHEITLAEMMQSRDWVQFMLDLPMVAEPGSRFEYCSGGMHLLSGVISRITGGSALQFARGELFQPLGITDFVWPSDPNGLTYGWGDLHLRPGDMAKLGYLWLNQGRWENQQILPAEWLQAATQPHSRADWGDQYGYGFWVRPERTPPMFEALGRGSQRISVVPGLNLVVVFVGGAFEPGEIGDFIGRALKSDTPLPENPVAASRLAAAVKSAAQPPPARSTPPEPPTAKAISGCTYLLETNPLGLKSFSFTFAGGHQAHARLEFADGHVEQRPIGMDGVPRLSLGRFGLPVALQGSWQGQTTFVFDYDEVANINSYRFSLRFNGRIVSVDVHERSGLVEAQFQGRSSN